MHPNLLQLEVRGDTNQILLLILVLNGKAVREHCAVEVRNLLTQGWESLENGVD